MFDCKAQLAKLKIFCFSKSANHIPKSFTVGFSLSKNIASDTIFSIIETAIKAAGDDYNSVMKFLGVLNGNRYSIPGEYSKEITFNKKNYFLTSVDDMILINISIPK